MGGGGHALVYFKCSPALLVCLFLTCEPSPQKPHLCLSHFLAKLLPDVSWNSIFERNFKFIL